jgi:hypothetical protein
MNGRCRIYCGNILMWRTQVKAFEYGFRLGKLVVDFLYEPVSLRFTAGLFVTHGSLTAVELRDRVGQKLASCDIGSWRGARVRTGTVEDIRRMGSLWRQVHDEVMRQDAQLYPNDGSVILDTAVKILHGSSDMADQLACYQA